MIVNEHASIVETVDNFHLINQCVRLLWKEWKSIIYRCSNYLMYIVLRPLCLSLLYLLFCIFFYAINSFNRSNVIYCSKLHYCGWRSFQCINVTSCNYYMQSSKLVNMSIFLSDFLEFLKQILMNFMEIWIENILWYLLSFFHTDSCMIVINQWHTNH